MTEARLADVEKKQDRMLLMLENLSEKMDSRIEHTDSWRERMDLVIMGDGNGRKGYNVRIDRLEQTAERQKWLVRTLFGAVMVMMVRLAFQAM